MLEHLRERRERDRHQSLGRPEVGVGGPLWRLHREPRGAAEARGGPGTRGPAGGDAGGRRFSLIPQALEPSSEVRADYDAPGPRPFSSLPFPPSTDPFIGQLLSGGRRADLDFIYVCPNDRAINLRTSDFELLLIVSKCLLQFSILLFSVIPPSCAMLQG